MALRRQGGKNNATAVLAAATGARPDVVLFWLLCGNSLADDGYFQAAIGYYHEAIRLDPTSVWAFVELAAALLESDQRVAAVEAYRTLFRRPVAFSTFDTDARVRGAQAALRRAFMKVDENAPDKRDRVAPTSAEKLELRRNALRWLREWLGAKPTLRDLFLVENDSAFAFAFAPQYRTEMSIEEARRWDYLLDDIRDLRKSNRDTVRWVPPPRPPVRPPLGPPPLAPPPRPVNP